MITIPIAIQESKDIQSLIKSHINFGETSFHQLDHLDKERLIKHCIIAMGSDALQDMLCGDNDKLLDNIITHIESYTNVAAGHAIDLMIESAIQSYAPYIEQLFTEAIEQSEAQRHFEAGHRRYIDPTNGEVRYV